MKYANKCLVLGAGLLGAGVAAQAAIPAELTTLLADANTTLTSVQDFAIVVAVFSIILGIVWKIRRKTA